MGEMKAYGILIGRSEGKIPHRRPTLEDGINMDLIGTGVRMWSAFM
jgi:hypothetical protein